MMVQRRSRAIRSAFGELVDLKTGPVTRYGYAGAWGCQEHDNAKSEAGCPPRSCNDIVC